MLRSVKARLHFDALTSQFDGCLCGRRSVLHKDDFSLLDKLKHGANFQWCKRGLLLNARRRRTLHFRRQARPTQLQISSYVTGNCNLPRNSMHLLQKLNFQANTYFTWVAATLVTTRFVSTRHKRVLSRSPPSSQLLQPLMLTSGNTLEECVK